MHRASHEQPKGFCVAFFRRLVLTCSVVVFGLFAGYCGLDAILHGGDGGQRGEPGSHPGSHPRRVKTAALRRARLNPNPPHCEPWPDCAETNTSHCLPWPSCGCEIHCEPWPLCAETEIHEDLCQPYPYCVCPNLRKTTTPEPTTTPVYTETTTPVPTTTTTMTTTTTTTPLQTTTTTPPPTTTG